MCVVAPNCARIAEALLLSYGFTETSVLSGNLAKFLDNLKCQVCYYITYYSQCNLMNGGRVI